MGVLNLITDLDLNFLYWLGLFGHSLLRSKPSLTSALRFCTRMRALISKVHRALRRGMFSSLMRRGICGREMWKMDSVVTDVGWGGGGGLYSSLSFLFICFRDHLSPKSHCLPSSLSCTSSFQSTYSSVF